MSKEIEKIFNRIDENKDGKISPKELSKTVRALNAGITDREVEAMIQEMDTNKDGYVDMKEFSEFHRKSDDEDGDLKDAFDMYDVNKNGLISSSELHLILGKLRENCSVEDCQRMIAEIDSDGDGFVDFDEFKRMMMGRGED